MEFDRQKRDLGRYPLYINSVGVWIDNVKRC